MDVESQMLPPYQGQKDRLVVGQRLGGTSRGSEVSTMRGLRPLQSGQCAVSRWTSIWAFYRTRCINVLAVVFKSLAWGGGWGLWGCRYCFQQSPYASHSSCGGSWSR